MKTHAHPYNGFQGYLWDPEIPEQQQLPIRLFKPHVTAGKLYPLVLFLHGAGERGEENLKHLEHGMWGTGRVPGLFTAQSLQQLQPCFVLAPQCPENLRWVESDWAQGSYDSDAVPISRCMRSVLSLVDRMLEKDPVDASRIYLCGLSMGGFGCWDLLIRRPSFFAAAIPICGGGDPRKAHLFAKIPLWVFHGLLDPTVPVQASRDMVQALRAAGSNVRYTETPSIPGSDHAAWLPFLENPEVLAWLLDQRKR